MADSPTHEIVQSVNHTGDVLAVASTPNNHYIIAGSGRAIVKSDLRTGEEDKRRENAHGSNVWALATGAIIVSCSYISSAVKVCNMDLEPEQSLEGHESTVWSVDISPDSTMIVSGDANVVVKIWKKRGVGSWACVKTLKDYIATVFAVVFSPNGEMLATAGGDKKINVYSVANNFSHMHTLEGHTDQVISLSFSPDSSRLVSGSFDKSLRLWNPTAGTLLKTVNNAHTNWIYAITHSPNGNLIASGSRRQHDQHL